MIRVLITGSDGFIGRNLIAHLKTRPEVEIRCFTRRDSTDCLPSLLWGVDVVYHLAGVNRPLEPDEFREGNHRLTRLLCTIVHIEAKRLARSISFVFSSSTHAEFESEYGVSKRLAENEVLALAGLNGIRPYVFRLPNVFGKWCKPNYNSFVATFCHNIARDVPIDIHKPNANVTLVYIDDVIREFVRLLPSPEVGPDPTDFRVVQPEYNSSVGEVAELLRQFRKSRSTLNVGDVGGGLARALYSTYLSYLQPNEFAYSVPRYQDSRGVFVEMVKTPRSGQFSYFTAKPGVTRGRHYHHTKTEKFLVISGRALFSFVSVATNDVHEIEVSGEDGTIVESIPGWIHEVSNLGANDLVVAIWANEIFDRNLPDTFPGAQ